MEFLGHACAADHAAPFQNAYAQARHAQIGRAGQPVVTAADNDGIEVGHRWHADSISQNGCREDVP